MSAWHRPDVESAAIEYLTTVVGPKSARQIVDGLLAKGRESAVPVATAPLSEQQLATARTTAFRQASDAMAAQGYEDGRELLASMAAAEGGDSEADRDAAEPPEVERLRAMGKAVSEFVAARAEYITAIRNCHPDNARDYYRWQGHAESRRQLAQTLGLPVAWPAEDGERS